MCSNLHYWYLFYPIQKRAQFKKKIIIDDLLFFLFFRYLISRGYGHPQDKDSGGSDDDMSDEGPDDMLPSTSRDRLDASGMYLISITLNIFVRFLNRVSRKYKSGVGRQLLSYEGWRSGWRDMLPSTSRNSLNASGMYLIYITLNIFVRFLNRVSLIYKSGVVRQLVMSDKGSDDILPSTRRDRLDASGTSYLIFITL